MKILKKLLFLFAVSTCHLTLAQSFKIGTIDIYGNRKIHFDTILAHLTVKEGDSISHESFKPEDITFTIEQIQGVKHAAVHPVCCDTAGNLMLYIGIDDTGSMILKHRSAPLQNIQLPDTIITAYNRLNDHIEVAVRSGQGSEDDSHGYALLNYQPAREEQNRFIAFANQNFLLITNILKNSKFAYYRAAAAEIIAYSINRKSVVANLLYAVDDPDEGVRNNATRALGVLAGYVQLHPEFKIKIPAGSFIKMVNSLSWTDRNKGASVLLQLTQSRNPQLLRQIMQQALLSIIEMAKWKDRGHAFFSFMILGRIAGIDEASLISKNISKDWPQHIDKMINKCCRNSN